MTVTGVSKVYETSPVDGPGGPYLNAAVRTLTTRHVGALLSGLRGIELRMGRTQFPATRNAPRVIDLDLLLYGSLVRRTRSLTVPHRRLHQRKFAIRPLLDLDPALVHPGSRRPVRSFLAGLPRSQRIRRVRA